MPKSLGLIDIGGRLTAWELILLNDITSLPVNPFVLAEKNDIQALTYQQLAENTGNTVEFYETEYNKTAFSYQLNDDYYIAYKSELHIDKAILRVAVMHELCHIFLKHPTYGDSFTGNILERSAIAELEANKLMRRIMAPSIILHMCGCSSAEEIAALCGVPMDLAEQRYYHLQDLRHRNAFLISDHERDLLNNFVWFINSYIADKHQ